MIIRRRSVIILTAMFAVVILVLAYSGIESSRSNMLKLIRQEGESLMQALVTSAANNLAASVIMEAADADRLTEIGVTLSQLLSIDSRFLDSLDAWERRFGFERIDLIDRDLKIVSSSWGELVSSLYDGDSTALLAIDSVQTGARVCAVAAPMPSALPLERFIYVAVSTSRGTLVIEAPVRRLTDYQESLGIGYVVREIGAQDAVVYALLQTEEGILLASRNIRRMIAIDADPFLQEALEHEEIVDRLWEFEDVEVLEVVRSFKTDVMPSGLLRLGMSLDVYRELSADSFKQLLILSVVLFLLGVVGVYAVTSSRKLQVTTAGLEQLRSSTDEIIQSVETAIVAIDKDGAITLFNPHAERLFALSSKAVLGTPYQSHFADDLLDLDHIRRKQTRVIRGEKMVPSAAGESRHLLVSASPLYDGRGGYAGSVALAYDLTEIKRLEENARASERLSELGGLAAGVAHEIRNPLNSIAIATQRLGLEFKPKERETEYQAFLETITTEIERLNSIIKNFLSLARGGRIDKVLVDLEPYLADILALARLEAETRSVQIRAELEEGLQVQLDPEEMKKVFLNLLRNALQSIDNAGDITIRGKRLKAGRVQIDIVNSGRPIPESDRNRIFQPYFTTRPEGTGLGLAICRRIIVDHGGSIELLPGEPTTFRLTI